MPKIIVRREGRDFGSKVAYKSARLSRSIRVSMYAESLENIKVVDSKTNYTNKGVHLW